MNLGYEGSSAAIPPAIENSSTAVATRFTRRVALILISDSAHFRFRRWKISTAPEMAIAEYSTV